MKIIKQSMYIYFIYGSSGILTFNHEYSVDYLVWVYQLAEGTKSEINLEK